MSFLACPDCGNHIRREAEACPFCRATPGASTLQRTASAALMGLALVAADFGCATTQPLYGVAVTDSKVGDTDTDTDSDADTDADADTDSDADSDPTGDTGSLIHRDNTRTSHTHGTGRSSMMRTLVLACALTGCHNDTIFNNIEACPPGFVADQGVCDFDEQAVIDLVVAYDQGDLERVNEETFMQTMGPNIERNVWVSPLPLNDRFETAVDLYAGLDPADMALTLPEPFPLGTMIVHEAVNREEAHGVVVKRAEGFDPERSDWWFGMVWDDGALDEDALEYACESCHGIRGDTDMLWGVPRGPD